jgi:hypothetical protein
MIKKERKKERKKDTVYKLSLQDSANGCLKIPTDGSTGYFH